MIFGIDFFLFMYRLCMKEGKMFCIILAQNSLS